MSARALASVAPATIAEAEATLRAAASDGAAVLFRGGGTAQGIGYPPERVDLELDTRALVRIVEYAPDDFVATLEAGTTLASLQRTLAEHGQRLALDPPLAERATLGGLIAANTYGPLRTRYGTLRDLLLGIELIRADGVPVRGGGKVVKNVAGFDVPKLAIGSLGTLGLIASVTLRLHPRPEAVREVSVEGLGASALRSLVRALVEAQLEPAALVAFHGEGAYEARIAFEGFAAGADDQADRAA
ncbi:MAG: FAD-binding oxidoreductase, partial [Vulcanimicrobiaceae bacterium]